MTVYYNEKDPYAAKWLENLISAGHIAPGIVDNRDIREVRPADLAGFTQCHFFAGIGVWSYALRLAGWPDERPIWTGSCPCQPFSGAGRRQGIEDERHLWPIWHRLIEKCKPATILGEQVASRLAMEWLDIVSADLENANYAFGAADLCAASVGAPHWRQRFYWVADSAGPRYYRTFQGAEEQTRNETWLFVPGSSNSTRDVADADKSRLSLRKCQKLSGTQRNQKGRTTGQCGRAFGQLADADSNGRSARQQAVETVGYGNSTQSDGCDRRPDPVNSFWRDVDWLRCTDGKWRAVEPFTQPLAHGVAGRVGRLRAYGNALCAPQAEAFIKAAMLALGDIR